VREIESALREGRIADYRDRRYSNYKALTAPENHLSIYSRHISQLYAAVPDDLVMSVGLAVAERA